MNHTLPLPFAWVDIPPSKEDGSLIPNRAFAISKYPITNAQFACFIEAGGYQTRDYWTGAGWELRERKGLIAPRFWGDSRWCGDDYPVVGVSWYEAMAFCRWLGDTINLPTDSQWQRAAQGDDGRAYPWGDQWDASRCNHEREYTTPVRAYEGIGDSPFGVTDMAGNICEWCLTGLPGKPEVIEGQEARLLHVETRISRGGAYYMDDYDLFRTTARLNHKPNVRLSTIGFRIVRMS